MIFSSSSSAFKSAFKTDFQTMPGGRRRHYAWFCLACNIVRSLVGVSAPVMQVHVYQLIGNSVKTIVSTP
eukprot:48990-Amphidinium_carterae.1